MLGKHPGMSVFSWDCTAGPLLCVWISYHDLELLLLFFFK